MTTAENKTLVRRFIAEVLEAGRLDAIPDYCIPGSLFAGGIAGQIQVMKSAFPDLHMDIVEMLAEGDKVAVRLTTQGTHTGPLAGLPAFGRLESPVAPTGRVVEGTAIYLFTIAGGKIVSYTAEIDQLGLLRQLGWTITPP